MQYFEYGIKKNGNYYIQKNNSIIQVYCQFDGMGYENCQDYFNNAYNRFVYTGCFELQFYKTLISIVYIHQ